MIAVVNYKAGNVGSIINMLKFLCIPAYIANTPEELVNASRIILPGIGHFDTCARNLREMGFQDALNRLIVNQRVPLLGICVGAQLLTRGSEEGNEPGLGWIPAVTKRFPAIVDQNYKVPHMGWNIAEPAVEHEIFLGFDVSPRFYFVHSYFIECDKPSSILCRTKHGLNFASGIVKENIIGVQFHPEKSHRFGMQLLKNFSTAMLENII